MTCSGTDFKEDKMQRVVITGAGTISPIGNDVATFWDNMKAGNSGVAPIESFDASETGVTVAAEVIDFNPKDTLGRKEYSRMDSFSQFGVAASVEAMNNSGYDIEANDNHVVVIVGSGISGCPSIRDG